MNERAWATLKVMKLLETIGGNLSPDYYPNEISIIYAHNATDLVRVTFYWKAIGKIVVDFERKDQTATIVLDTNIEIDKSGILDDALKGVQHIADYVYYEVMQIGEGES